MEEGGKRMQTLDRQELKLPVYLRDHPGPQSLESLAAANAATSPIMAFTMASSLRKAGLIILSHHQALAQREFYAAITEAGYNLVAT
jgi:hypothetical protein